MPGTPGQEGPGPLDPELLRLYTRKTIRWSTKGTSIELDIPADLFSSFQIDTGTRGLLREAAASGRAWRETLDLGCGYGPICVYLVATGLTDRAAAVDRDALAVAFTAHNAARNGLGGRIAAWGGLAYEGLAGRRFDAVFCNLPAKAGPPVHRAILLGAARHLASGGEAWVVVVRPLEQAADSILASGGAEVRLKAAGKEHVVYSYVLPGAPPPAEPSYERTRQSFQWRTWSYELTSLYGLAEFDTRSWLTNLLLDFYWQAFRRRRHEPRDVMVCNPTQGHVPVLLARMAGGLERMEIVSRDLLALQAVRRNLADNGFAGAVRCSHTAELCSAFGDANPQAILVTLREKEGLEVNLHKLRALAARYPQAAALVACRASFGARVLAALKAAGVPARPGRKKKGCCVFSLGEQPW